MVLRSGRRARWSAISAPGSPGGYDRECRSVSMRRERRFAALLCACLFLLPGCGRSSPAAPLSDRITNADEVVISLRHGLKNHAQSITVTFDYGSNIFSALNEVIDAWMELALAETDDPAEGDYIRFQYGGYTYNSSYTVDEAGRLHYTVKITPVYYSYLAQERKVTDEVKSLRKRFSFSLWTTDAEKIRTIYDYLCRNVKYDKIHRKNPYYHLNSTAYAALIQKTATCQGYCAALYRLLRECGVECRIVTGTAVGEDGESEELHAWVIAAVDGLYYGLDPTWDAGADEYRYFLVGSEALADHALAGKYASADFAAAYPMAAESYSAGDA